MAQTKHVLRLPILTPAPEGLKPEEIPGWINMVLLPSIAAAIRDFAPAAGAPAYTPTNVTDDRGYDANLTSVDELADVLGTLIVDLRSKRIIG